MVSLYNAVKGDKYDPDPIFVKNADTYSTRLIIVLERFDYFIRVSKRLERKKASKSGAVGSGSTFCLGSDLL